MSKLVSFPCDLCGADQPVPVLEEQGFRVCRCARCSLTYVTPRPELEAGEDVGHFQDNEWTAKAERTAREAVDVYAEGLDRLEALRPQRGRLLDLGCGFGFFLRSAEERGWKTYGIDVSEYGVNYAKGRLGLANVDRCDLFQAHFPERRFQAVTLWNLLEHVPSPSALLAETHRVLARDGVLLVRVPNMLFSELIWRVRVPLRRALARRRWSYLATPPPQHLFGFTPSTLQSVLEKAGLQVLRIEPAAVKIGSYRRRGRQVVVAARAAAILARIAYRMSFGTWNISPTMCAYARRTD